MKAEFGIKNEECRMKKPGAARRGRKRRLQVSRCGWSLAPDTGASRTGNRPCQAGQTRPICGKGIRAKSWESGFVKPRQALSNPRESRLIPLCGTATNQGASRTDQSNRIQPNPSKSNQKMKTELNTSQRRVNWGIGKLVSVAGDGYCHGARAPIAQMDRAAVS